MANKGFEIIPPLVALSKIPRILHNPIPVFKENLTKYGDPYGVRMGNKMAMLTSRPEIVQHFLQKNHRNYNKSDIQTEKLAMFLGKGLLTLDGSEWLRQRRLIQPGFHREKIEAVKEKMDDAITEFYDQLSKEMKPEASIDIHDQMMVLAFKIVSNSLFGSSASENQIKQLRYAIQVSQVALIKLMRLPFLEWWFNITGMKDHALKQIDKSCEDLLDIIHTRRREGTKGDLLDMLMEAKYEDTGEYMTDQQLLFELMILFVAGHETTANSLSWTFYLLAKNPDILTKLRKEIDNGDKTYLKQVINESLRIYPPAWITDRLSIEEDEVAGIHIPKNTLMAGYIYGIHHNPNFWDEAQTFNPDRFSPDKSIVPYTFLPFGGGPRLCIGMQFALMEMELAITHFIQRFDFQLTSKEEVLLKPLVTLNPRGPIEMKIRLR